MNHYIELIIHLYLIVNDLISFLFCSAVFLPPKSAQPLFLSTWTVSRSSNQAVAKGIIIRKMLMACLGTRKALLSARLLLRKKCQDRKKIVRGQMGTDTHRSKEYREQKVMATSASFFEKSFCWKDFVFKTYLCIGVADDD